MPDHKGKKGVDQISVGVWSKFLWGGGGGEEWWIRRG